MTYCNSLNQFLSNPTAYTYLDLPNQNLSDNDVVRLMNVLNSNQTVTNLSLHQNQIGDVGAKAIGQGLAQNKTLTTLYLYNNKIGDGGASAIGQGLAQNKSVTFLRLDCNQIGGVGAVAIGQGLAQNKTLTTLYLYNNKIGDGGAAAIGQGLTHNKALTYLRLEYNQIGNVGAKAIGQGLAQNKTLTILNMDQNQIGDGGAAVVGQGLTHNKTLTTLGLFQNQIGDGGAAAIGRGLAQNKTLTTLYLRGNKIGDGGAAVIGQNLAQNQTLIHISLDQNQIGEKVVNSLKSQLSRLGGNLQLYNQSAPKEKQDIAIKEQSKKEKFDLDSWKLAFDNDLNLLQQWVDNGVDIDKVDEDGRSLLWKAALLGEEELVLKLLDQSQNLTLVDSQGVSILDVSKFLFDKKLASMIKAAIIADYAYENKDFQAELNDEVVNLAAGDELENLCRKVFWQRLGFKIKANGINEYWTESAYKQNVEKLVAASIGNFPGLDKNIINILQNLYTNRSNVLDKALKLINSSLGTRNINLEKLLLHKEEMVELMVFDKGLAETIRGLQKVILEQNIKLLISDILDLYDSFNPGITRLIQKNHVKDDVVMKILKNIDQDDLFFGDYDRSISAFTFSLNGESFEEIKINKKEDVIAMKSKQQPEKEVVEEYFPSIDEQLTNIFPVKAAGMEVDESILHKIRNLIKEGNDRLQNVEEHGIMLLGETGSGKSTLAHLLSNRKLQAIRDDETFAMIIDALQPLDEIKISHNKVSETTIPNRCVNGDVVIWDCPGINDTAGTAQEIANAFYVQKLFEKNKQVKFLFVIPDSALIDNRGSSFVKTVSQLSKMFNDVDMLEGSASLIVTRAPSGKQPIHITKSINRILDQNENIPEISRKIMEMLKHSVHLFHTPTVEGELPNMDMLSDINAQTKYIESNPKFANMAISDEAMLHSKHLLEIVKNKFNNLLNVFVSAVVSANDSIRPGSESNIFEQKHDLIKDWIPSSMDYKDIKGIQQEPFMNLKLLAFLRAGLAVKNVKSLEESLPIFQRVLTIFEKFVPETEANGVTLKYKIQEYSYTLLQQLDYIKFFSKLCGEEAVSDYGQEIQNIVSKCYAMLDDNFTYQLKTTKLESNQDENYYKVILKYLDNADSQTCLSLKSEALKHLGKIAENSGDDSAALDYYIKSISAYPHNPDAYNIAGDLFAKQGKYDEAISFYKVANNPINIKRCFKKWLELEPDNPDVMIKRADHLTSIGAFDKAKIYYNYALGLSKNEEETKSIAKKISNIMLQKMEVAAYYQEIEETGNFHNYDLVNEEFMDWLPSLLGEGCADA